MYEQEPSMSKHSKERQLITEKTTLFPYGSKTVLWFGPDVKFDFGESVCLLIDEPYIVTLDVLPSKPREVELRVKRVQVSSEGFRTASDAERVGLRVALAFLWSAISRRFSMRLQYHTPLPTIVYDRTRSGGISVSAEGEVTRTLQAPELSQLVNQGLSNKDIPAENLLVSMELFVSAQLEVTDRTRFISLVSALEPLVTSMNLGSEVETLILHFSKQLKQDTTIPDPIKQSLNGRLMQLRQESIAQAIARLVKTYLPNNDEALEKIKEAYSLRSKMLHEGQRIDELPQRSHELEEYLRKLYATIIGHPLYC